MAHSSMPLSEAIIKERVERTVYCNFVHYVRMDEYKKEYRSVLIL
ncbi:MAG: hypothetical protein QXW80_03920 [Candidatus Micrarchaeia archaeon]